jgi:hypothetical protein
MIFLGSVYENTIKRKLFNLILRRFERRFIYEIYNDQNLCHATSHPAKRFSSTDVSWYHNGKHHRYYGPAIHWRDFELGVVYPRIHWIIHGLRIK